MKLRKSRRQEKKIAPEMAPMIDIVFLLLVFFMLTLKIIPPEGNFTINMPQRAIDPRPDEIIFPDIKIRLVADDVTGDLAELRIGKRSLGNDPERVYADLNSEILSIIGRPGNPLTKDLEVTIEADYNLKYQHALKAVSACRGRIDDTTGEVVPYIQRVQFAPSHRKPNS